MSTSAEFHFSPVFQKNVISAHGDGGRTWLSTLPALVHSIAQELGLSDLKPVVDLSYNFVATARKDRDAHVILKISPPDVAITSESAWLKRFSPVTPQVIATNAEQNYLLMERVFPGTSLKGFFSEKDDDVATTEIARTICSLRQNSVQIEGYRHLAELEKDFDALSEFGFSTVAQKAKGLWQDLNADRSKDTLLHGDLHHDNILRDGIGWKVIDPHGYVGSPVSDCGVMIFNPIDRYTAHLPRSEVVERRLRILADVTGDDLQEIKAWCFCKTVISAAWNVRNFQAQARNQISLAQEIERFFV